MSSSSYTGSRDAWRDTLPPLENVLITHGISAKKSLGQHFLLDDAITGRIARSAGNLSGVNVVEVGPGPGGLTRALLEAGAGKIFAIEKDARCIAALAEIKAATGDRLEIVEADALAVDVAAIAPAPRKIVANLPYNIGTELLLGWLDLIYSLPLEGGGGEAKPSRWGSSTPKDDPHLNPPPCRGRKVFESLTLMFQKEVAERIVAAPGSRDYGRLSVLSQWLCEAEIVFELPPEAFTPPPKVSSSVVVLTPRAAPLVAVEKKTLEKITAAAFGQRRKMLRQSLKNVGGEALLKEAGIDPTLRPEQLDVATLCRLAAAYHRLSTNPLSPG